MSQGFAVAVGAWARKGPQAVDQLRRAVTLEVMGRVIEATPVGQPDLWARKAPKGYVGGQARGSWRCGVGEAPPSPGPVDATGGAPRAEVAAAVAASSPRDVVVLRSSLAYIWALEHGHSTQAPQGMVRRAAAAVHQLVKQQRKRLT